MPYNVGLRLTDLSCYAACSHPAIAQPFVSGPGFFTIPPAAINGHRTQAT